ncbi:hypothetical protein DENSPDRAFT_745576, partial [Dentipellis sp. KUC8613]
GNWIGDVPEQLKDLSFVEKMLVARLRHNYCIMKVVKSGQYKMKANAIMFEVPMPKIYQALPPPRADLDEVLAYIYIGSIKPSEEDHKRSPMLVRRNKVKIALEWLKLNHSNYADLDISESNLAEYPENVPPVVCDYRRPPEHKNSENLAVNKNEEEEGTDKGPCPFIVH